MSRQAEITHAALGLLEDTGKDGVSLRAVADRLGVRLNTITWHVGSKAGLLELMADAIVGEVRLSNLPKPWEPRVWELAKRYRAALLNHRDGAAIVAGTYPAKPNTLGVGNAFVQALLDSGCGEAAAAWTMWTIDYFTLGLTQEEQGEPEAVGERLAEAVTAERFPAMARVLNHMGGSFDDRYRFGLDLILKGLRG